jgi:hypothetical protein
LVEKLLWNHGKVPSLGNETGRFYPILGPIELSLGRHRARCLTVRLPMPPVRPVRETFASYGSRQRDIMGKVHFASSTVHSPWTALRVRWVPVYCFPTLSLRAFAMCAVFPHSDYYALFDCLEGFGVSLGSRLPTVHPPSHPFQALPCSLWRTQTRRFRWRIVNCPIRSLRLPRRSMG